MTLVENIVSFFDRFRASPPPTVAVIRLQGPITAGARLGRGISIENTAKLIKKAFAIPRVSAVALQINSPGGSPVQSALVMKRIRDLANEKDIPVLAFAEDVAASGGYMLACAADEIYAHESSIIGSIGVIFSGFGFVEAIKKLGIERRLFTSGDNKSMLDPFETAKKEDVDKIKSLQSQIHEDFKKLVRERRGKRLKGARAKIFSGDVFLGAEAVKHGLIDGIGDIRGTLYERFGDDVRLRLIEHEKPKVASLLGLFGSFQSKGGIDVGDLDDFGSSSTGLTDDLISALETKFWWSKWGL
jgi:signal peptide peptidase SppA